MLQTAVTNAPPTAQPEEGWETLQVMAHRRAGAIPAALLADHVEAISEGGNWPVSRAAMEAILRRWGFAKRDRLKVAKRPAGRGVFGAYETRRPRSPKRPYVTQLFSVSPLRASCECMDFRKNSLGLCKHVLTVLDTLARTPRRFAQAQQQPALEPMLKWAPYRPLLGPGDWLERAQLDGRPAHPPTPKSNPKARLAQTQQLLAAGKRDDNADVALMALLREEEAALKLDLDMPSKAEQRQALRSLKCKLYPYQREGLQAFLSRRQLLLADDMGLGKTAQAIAGAHVLWHTKRVRRGLILVPASLKSQWLREWQRFTDVPAAMVEGNPSEREALYRKTRRGFLIVNYEVLLRDLLPLRAWGAELVVLDEAQRIKNWNTKTASFVKRLQPQYRLALTGTPLENRLEELVSILEWVDPLALEPSWRLGPWHRYHDDANRASGIHHLDTLRQRLSHSTVRRVRQEVLDQLPPRTDTAVPITFTAAQEEAHHDLARPIRQLMQRAAKRPLSQPEFLRLMSLLTRQRLICNGMALAQFEDHWPAIRNTACTDGLLQSLCAPKLSELRQLVTSLVRDQDRKVVIFSQWRRMLQLARWATQDILQQCGRRAVDFTGAQNQRQRTHNIIDFHDDPRCAVLLASDAGGVGLNLQRAANCCINLDLPWNPAVLEQRIGRIYRLGQTDPIEVFNLICEAGIEARIARVVNTKQALFKGLFDGDSDTVLFDGESGFTKRVEMLVDPAEDTGDQVDDGADDDEQDAQDEREALAEWPSDSGPTSENESTDSRAAPAAAAAQSAPQPAPTVPAKAPVATPPSQTDTGAIESNPPTPNAAAAPTVAAPSPTAPPPSVGQAPAADVASLLASVRVETTANGSVTITAPPQAASTLCAVFQGMAQLMATASPPPAVE